MKAKELKEGIKFWWKGDLYTVFAISKPYEKHGATWVDVLTTAPSCITRPADEVMAIEKTDIDALYKELKGIEQPE